MNDKMRRNRPFLESLSMAAVLAGCASSTIGTGAPTTNPTILSRPSPETTATPPGRTFLVLTWRSKFTTGKQVGPVDFPSVGRRASVYASEELVGQPYGQPYHATISGSCASVSPQTSDHRFTLRSIASGNCKLVIKDSLKTPNIKKLAITVR